MFKLNIHDVFPLVVEYGHDGEKHANVTIHALVKCLQNEKLIIPAQDQARNDVFGDPFFGIVKSVFITDKHGHKTAYPAGMAIEYVVEETKNPFARAFHDVSWTKSRLTPLTQPAAQNELDSKFVFQIICALFVQRYSPILEIGAGDGSTSLVLSSLLPKETLLVSLEPDPATFLKLKQNAAQNGIPLEMQEVALSHVPLMQNLATKATAVVPQHGMPVGYDLVSQTKTITELEIQYHCKFATLIFDCGAAALQMLQDDAEYLLRNAFCVILVNEMTPSHKMIFDSIMVQHGMHCVFQHAGPKNPRDNYEVWYNAFSKRQENVHLHT